MIKKLLMFCVASMFIVSCASSPEVGKDGKHEKPENIDSDISFEGVSNPDSDPFFSEPIEGEHNPQASAESEPEEVAELPDPTPEPSAEPDPTFTEQAAPEEEYEEPVAEATYEEPPAPTPVARKTANKKPASVNVPDAMRAPGTDCSLRSAPGASASKLGIAKRGRKIWTENHDGGWFKVYRKKGHAFVSKNCF